MTEEEKEILDEIQRCKECEKKLSEIKEIYRDTCDKNKIYGCNIENFYMAYKKNENRMESLRVDLCKIRGE